MSHYSPFYRWNRFLIGTDAELALITFYEALQLLVTQFRRDEKEKDDPTTVAFINTNSANIARKDNEYRKALTSFSHLFSDGIGLRIAALLHGLHSVNNVSGTDLVPTLLNTPELLGTRVFLLGDRPENINTVSNNFPRLFPNVVLVGHHHGFFSAQDNNRIIELINASHADILLIGMGTPLQEKWVSDNAHLLKTRLQITVGGLFQYWDGRLLRAPHIAQKLGLEWACILAQQPFKWRRYLLGNPIFLYHAVMSSLGRPKLSHGL